MSNIADAFPGRMCYTYSMKDCKQRALWVTPTCRAFLMPKGGEPSAKETITAVRLSRMSEVM